MMQNRKIISNIIFLNSYTDGTLDKVHGESFMMYFSFFFCISVLKRNSKVTGYIVSYFADLHPSATVKAAFINLKLIKAKKKDLSISFKIHDFVIAIDSNEGG